MCDVHRNKKQTTGAQCRHTQCSPAARATVLLQKFASADSVMWLKSLGCNEQATCTMRCHRRRFDVCSWGFKMRLQRWLSAWKGKLVVRFATCYLHRESHVLSKSSSSSSSSLSPLCRVFIHIVLRQTMSLGNTVFQLFCHYYLWCLYR